MEMYESFLLLPVARTMQQQPNEFTGYQSEEFRLHSRFIAISEQ